MEDGVDSSPLMNNLQRKVTVPRQFNMDQLISESYDTGNNSNKRIR